MYKVDGDGNVNFEIRLVLKLYIPGFTDLKKNLKRDNLSQNNICDVH